MTVGRRRRIDDTPLAEGKVDYLQIDEERRVVLSPVEFAPKTTGRTSRPIFGKIVLAPGQTAHMLTASWEGKDGPVVPADLPPFLSWCVQVKSGAAVLLASATATLYFDIPNTPGAFEESEGASVADWWVRETSEMAGAVLQIVATVAS